MTALARSSSCSSLLHRYMFDVLSADVSAFLDCLTILMLFFNFVRNWFLTFRNLITFSMSIRSFSNGTSSFTCFGHFNVFKNALYGLRQFLITESPWKMMKNAFYFTLKAFFVLKIFKFLSWLFGQAEKTSRLER